MLGELRQPALSEPTFLEKQNSNVYKLLTNGTSLRRESTTSELPHFLLIHRVRISKSNTRRAVPSTLLARRLHLAGLGCLSSSVVGFPFYLPFFCSAPLSYQAFKKSFLLSPGILKIVATVCRRRSRPCTEEVGLKEVSLETKTLELSTQRLGGAGLSLYFNLSS